MGSVLTLEAEQAGRRVPVRVTYDVPVWSGLSWAAGEVSRADMFPGSTITFRFTTPESKNVALSCQAYAVIYPNP